MTALLTGPLAAQRPTLLDELLEDSDRIYHRHCAIIQKAFYGQWLQTLRDQVSREPIVLPGESPAQVEARVRDRLTMYRQDLRRRQAGLIAEEREKHAGRDRAIRAYVASLHSPDQVA